MCISVEFCIHASAIEILPDNEIPIIHTRLRLKSSEGITEKIKV
jgi:hypothetical protein